MNKLTENKPIKDQKPKLTNCTVVVTCGAGFIGSNLVHELVKLEIKHSLSDNFKIKKLGFNTEYTLKNSMKTTYNFYIKNLNQMR